MTTAAIIVLVLRLVVPFTMLRWRISGAVASMALDGLDVVLVDLLAKTMGEPLGFSDYYQTFDKWLDMYYLTIEGYVALSWSNALSRKTAIALYVFRLIGIITFEATGEQHRKLIFFFPNLFENFFLFYIFAERFAPRFVPKNAKDMAIVLVLLYLPKLPQEWALHFAEAGPWNWFKETVLGLEPT
jgi:hypothetical protein